MGAPDLIFELRERGYSIKADGRYLDISPANDLPPEIVKQLKQHKPEILAALKLERQQEDRRQKVLAMLVERPELTRAIHTDTEADPVNVILTIAVRGVATGELLIPKARYQPWQLLALVDRVGELH